MDNDTLTGILRDVEAAGNAVWKGTKYLEVSEMFRRSHAGSDGRELIALATEKFAAAREANRTNRPRTAILLLEQALALYTMAGAGDETGTALGNLSLQYVKLGRPRTGFRLQALALRMKLQMQATPDRVARSMHILGEAEAILGALPEAIGLFRGVDELNRRGGDPGDSSVTSRLNELTDKLRVRKQLAIEEMSPGSDDDLQTCAMRAAQARVDGRHADAACLWARALGLAERAADWRAALYAGLALAEILYRDCRMFADARRRYADMAELAGGLGDATSQREALLGRARTAFETEDDQEAIQALEIALALPDDDASVMTRAELAALMVCAQLSTDSRETATAYMHLAFDSLRRVGHAEAVHCLMEHAIMFRRLEYLEQTAQCLERGLALSRAHSLRSNDVLRLHLTKIELDLIRRDAPAALAVCEDAVKIGRELGESGGLGQVLYWTCQAHLAIGDIHSAAITCSELAGLFNDTKDPDLGELARKLHLELAAPMAALLKVAEMKPEQVHGGFTGAPGTAPASDSIQVIRTMLGIAQQRGNTGEVVFFHGLLGSAFERMGHFAEAERQFQLGLLLALETRAPCDLGSILHDYAVLQARTGRLPAARQGFASALAWKDEYAGGKSRESSLIGLAQASALLGEVEGLESYEAALEGLISGSGEEERGSILLTLALLASRRGLPARELEMARLAARSFELSGTLDSAVNAMTLVARLELAAGHCAEARTWAQRALDHTDTWRATVLTVHRQAPSSLAVAASRVAIDACYALGQNLALEALAALEQVKARALIGQLTENALVPPESMPTELCKREDSLLFELRMARFLSESPFRRQGFEEPAQEAAARRALHEFWNTLPEPWAAYGRLRSGRPPNPDALQQLARQTAAHVVVMAPSGQRTYVWHILPGGQLASWNAVPLSEARLSAFVARGQDVNDRQGLTPDDADDIAATLLLPHLDDVPQGQAVILVPCGPLLQMPFAGLRIHERYLIERNPFWVISALSLLAIGQHQKTASRLASPLVLGDSRSDLPHAAREAHQVARHLHVSPVLGSAVLRLKLAERLARCDLLHYAGHAIFDKAAPDRSGLLLADGTRLSARDVANLRMRARLVVLSACATGAAEVLAGDELEGLVNGFLLAGASCIVTALWPVDDHTTAELMAEFYQQLSRGLSVPEALRSAQICSIARAHTRDSSSSTALPRDVTADFRHERPHWAAFQVWGLCDEPFVFSTGTQDHADVTGRAPGSR